MSVPGGPPPYQQPMQQPAGHPGGPGPAAPAKPADPAKTFAILLCVAAGLIVVGVFSKSWLTAGKGHEEEIHIGPMGAEICEGSMCVSAPSRMMSKLPGDLQAMQMVALIGGFAAAAACGVFGGMALANKKDKIPLSPKMGQIAMSIAAFGMSYFEFRGLAEGHGIGFGWAAIPGIGGVIMGGIALKKLSPFLAAGAAAPAAAGYPPAQYGAPGQPMQQGGYNPQASQPMQPQAAPPMQGQPMQAGQQAAPNCPRCGAPLQFAAQYQRWFCPQEQQYV